jgi:hypothetical protein
MKSNVGTPRLSACVLALSFMWIAQGCSSGSSSGGTGTGGTAPGTGGATPAGTGGTTPTGTGGTTPLGTGGRVGTGGTTPTGTGGTTPLGTGGRVGTGGAVGAGGGPPASGICPPGTANAGPCTGTATCSSTCGLADMGSRTCTCNGATNACVRCAFSPVAGGPLDPNTHPVPRPICGAAIADNVPCTTMGDFCQCDPVSSVGCMRAGVVTTQVCLCWPAGSASALQWDCDNIPF